MSEPTITPGQCRVARHLLKIKQASLAEDAGISRKTLVTFESDQAVKASTINRIAAALAEHGCQFGEDGMVKLRSAAE